MLRHARALEQLAARCGQPAAMHWMEYFLATRIFRWKRPCLVLLTHSNTQPDAIAIDDVRAAVLLFEYRPFGLPTGIFCTDDATAFRSVISGVEDRLAATGSAVNALMQAGAKMVCVSRDDGGRVPGLPQLDQETPALWACRSLPVAKTLLLDSSYEGTLKRLGKSTRFNLRYYRRRMLDKMPLEFVADARGLLTEDQLRAVNARSLNPVPWWLIRLQYNAACHARGGFLIGLRGPQGEWLSLIGGWRQDGTTVLHWQTNASGHERSSLTTVMRSYFIESEIARGTRALTFYGGTPHTIQHSFVKEHATDLIVRRRSVWVNLLVGVARLAAAVQRRFGRVNALLELLSDRHLVWRPAQDLQRTTRAGVAAGKSTCAPPEAGSSRVSAD